jgi:hypothetical protein
MKILLVCFVLNLVALVGFGQMPDFSAESGLKGLKTYSVDTGPDAKARERIVKAIGKKLPELQLVDDMAKSEIRVTFSDKIDAMPNSAVSHSGTISSGGKRAGPRQGAVFVAAPDLSDPRGRLVLVTLYENGDDSFEISEREMVVRFADLFIKIYKKANESK